MLKKIDLSVKFCGVVFQNPFMLSSSPVSNNAEMIGRAFDAGWGGVAYKSLASDRIKMIHPSPRMHGYHYGEKRLIGLQNVEQTSDRGLKPNLRDIKYLKKHYPKHVVMASIMGFSNQEWEELAKACTDAGADMLELNFSCPHMAVEGSGAKVGQTHDLVRKFTETVRNVTSLPLVAKLTPNAADMNEPAMAAKKGGANGISAINTVAGLSEVDLDNFIPKPDVFGKGAISGYSGPAIKPIGLRFIAQMSKNKELNLPLSGIGGIETWIDALEYILLGATTVQVTTGIIHYAYRIVEDMIEGLSDYMAQRQITRVADLVGKAVANLVETSDFDVKRQGIAHYNIKNSGTAKPGARVKRSDTIQPYANDCVGCGQCYIVCRDAGGSALEWDKKKRRPVLNEDKCLGCMVCSFICPVHNLITFKEMPKTWKRHPTLTLG
jgi:dihydropyrimidine dehydrogenase (NAD+) subunit PreA